MNKQHRLTLTRDFQRLYRSRMRVRENNMLICYARHGQCTVSRLGVVTPRHVGCAVERNKFKRRVRVCFDRLRVNVPCAFDLLVLALGHDAVKLPLREIESILVGRINQFNNMRANASR